MAKLAFCGLGQMGAPMAARLVDAGHDVTVWNRTPARAEPLRERGARVAATPAGAARGAEAAITMLADPAALEAVVLGPDGLAQGLGPGSALIEMSTVGPTAIRQLAERLPEGVDLIDAPVRGSVDAATGGRSASWRGPRTTPSSGGGRCWRSWARRPTPARWAPAPP